MRRHSDWQTEERFSEIFEHFGVDVGGTGWTRCFIQGGGSLLRRVSGRLGEVEPTRHSIQSARKPRWRIHAVQREHGNGLFRGDL